MNLFSLVKFGFPLALALVSLHSAAHGDSKNMSIGQVGNPDQIQRRIEIDMQDNMRFFYNTLTTVAAQKRAEKMQKEETDKVIQKMEMEEQARGNVNANIEAFNALKDSEKQSFINLGKLYHHARRGNNFTGMEKMKALIMNNLCDLNIGNHYVVAHVINLAG